MNKKNDEPSVTLSNYLGFTSGKLTAKRMKTFIWICDAGLFEKVESVSPPPF